MAEFEEKLSSILNNPQAMGQILSIAKSMTAEGEPPPQEEAPEDSPLSALGEVDPRILQIGLRLFSEYSSSDNQKIALLQALKPFLSEKRLKKVDKAIQIGKLSRVMSTAYRLFKEEGGGEDV